MTTRQTTDRPVAELMPVKLFRQDGSFITENGHLGCVFGVEGVDSEGMSDEARQAQVHRMLTALNVLGVDVRFSQYLIKTALPPVPAGVVTEERRQWLNQAGRARYGLEMYYVLVYEGLSAAPAAPWLDRLSPTRTITFAVEAIERSAARLNAVARQVAKNLDSCGLVRLDQAGTFRFLRRLVNYTDAGVCYQPGKAPLDFQLSDESVSQRYERDGYLIVGKTPVRMRTLKMLPDVTYAGVLAQVLATPGELIACLEWKQQPPGMVRETIHQLRRWINQGKRHWTAAIPGVDTTDSLVDESKMAEIADLGDALTEMSLKNQRAGSCSLSFVFHGAHAEAASIHVAGLMAEQSGDLFEETYNLINAWPAILPGGAKRNFRAIDRTLNVHLADLSFVFTASRGEQDHPVSILETASGVPYGLDLWVQSVGHTMIVAPTGGGKSVLMNHLIEHVHLRKPRTLAVFDQGHGYKRLCDALGGAYIRFGLDAGVAINPFAAPASPDRLYFLLAFVTKLLEGKDLTLGAEDSDRVYEAILRVFKHPVDDRNLTVFQEYLPRHLRPRLDMWVSGRFRRVFGQPRDEFHLCDVMVFELSRIKDYPELLAPVQFYLLDTIRERMASHPGLTSVWVDEAGELLRDPVIREYVERSMTQMRKQNGHLVLAFQHVEQFFASTVKIVAESCATKLFPPNAGMTQATAQQYAETFDLNPNELDLIRHAVCGQFVVKQAQRGARLLTLDLNPEALWRYSNAYHDHQVEAQRTQSTEVGR